MNLLFLYCVFLFAGPAFGQGPAILNTHGNANLKQEQGTSLCVYPVDTDPDADSCVQTTSFAQFELRKETGQPDYCVYFVSGALVPPSYTVYYTCDDGNGNTTDSYVKIDIIPNQKPIFTNGPADLKIVDASAILNGQTVFTVGATDDDADSLVFSMDTVFSEFDIDATGNVIARTDFSTVTTPSFSFKVLVTDNYTVTPTEQSVTLLLINRNTQPQVTNLPNPLTHPEDVAPGVVLYTCKHNDTSPVTQTFTVDPISELGVFDFNPTSCEISVKAGQKLDFETTPNMTMTLTLDDGVYTESFPFTFNVQNANDPPTFGAGSYTVDINEGPLPVTPATQPVFVVSDEDAGDTHNFSLGTGTYDSYFTIDSSTGALTCIRELDYDTGVRQVTVTVIVTDSGGETAEATVTVNVADYNDNDPVFDTGSTLYISPKTPVGKIGQVAATDIDAGDNARLTYDLISDNSGGKFLVQPDGSVFLQTLVTEADRNTIFSLVVRATDKGASPRTGDTTLTILFDPPPLIINIPNDAFISEDTTVKRDFFQIIVTDNDTFTCEVVLISPTTTPPAFVIEKKSGGNDWFVFYTGLVQLSHSTTPRYFIDVVCTDSNGGSSIRSTLTVNVRQNQLPTLDCSPVIFPVDAAVTTVGDIVRTIVATDDDTLSYQMALLPSSGTFTIGTNGEISCRRQMIRETISQYTGVITVSDVYNSVSCTITLTMTNTNEVPSFLGLPNSKTVAEDLLSGSLIAEVTVSDPQECDPTTFTWDVDPAGHKSKFEATINTKVVSLSLAPGQELDFELVQEYVFFFRANDGCLNSERYPLYLTVTGVNEKPEFLGGSNLVAYFGEVGNSAASLGCGGWDPDVSDTHTLTLHGTHSEKFVITDPSQCLVRPIVELDLDASGVPPTFQLTTRLTDAAGLSSEALVTIVVTEVNDNIPQCDQPAFTFGDIFNGDTIGRVLGRVTARDDDKAGSVNEQLTYKIVSPSSGTNVVDSTSDGTFKIIADPEAQLLVPGTMLDFTVEVTDEGTPPQSTTCKVNIQYIYTTTPPPPPTQATVAQSGTATTIGTVTTTLSDVEQALRNPVILALIAGLGALAALAAIAGLVYCCRKYGVCKGGNTGSTNRYDYRDSGPSRLRSRTASQPRQESPKTNQVGSTPNKTTSVDAYNTKPNAHDGPTTMKYL